ncbi:hypothetical protein AA23498_0996 [Acetobacter nitrogenifigens DSM 23921 = NBRC 105050]|uniref:Uncharacterized protein n=1 Tax=Acetobacter nitrogenifigens DSM 23921 = NBRC 105050 TaxID=1120919 RepID=A0A511XB96_9PROT|nr:hypothetical protein [Acetobacter nitrogenifigens]GBQ90832.1 hypothetical protein AA23498_0996 [Acetobacter nitrogenifigens DSM 23921 = NBRC 105050]GEN60234.1 hypothetical protein ANI02nite_21180 [Acetobacter nitrogenifigens DSM 23921 = NBRC 105050]
MLLDSSVTLSDVQDRLYRDDPAIVAEFYSEAVEARERILLGRLDHAAQPSGTPKALNVSRKGILKPGKTRIGLTVSEIAARPDLWVDQPPSDEDLRRLLIHAGWLATRPHGRNQPRTLATEKTIQGGYGHNVDPSSKHSIRLSGASRSFPFPVFYEDRLTEIVASVGWQSIVAACSLPGKQRDRLHWLLTNHGYLPNQTLADLSGAGEATVKRHRAKLAKEDTRGSCGLLMGDQRLFFVIGQPP